MFPSFDTHGVQKNKSTEIRYSLAFNVFMEGTLGEREGELKLFVN